MSSSYLLYDVLLQLDCGALLTVFNSAKDLQKIGKEIVAEVSVSKYLRKHVQLKCWLSFWSCSMHAASLCHLCMMRHHEGMHLLPQNIEKHWCKAYVCTALTSATVAFLPRAS